MAKNNELIVIEGIDGAGKTTVSEYIADSYGYSYMTQPEDSWVGEAARKALKDEKIDPACDLFLHLAAHANQQSRIESILEEESIVIDRYYQSRVAYQSVQTEFSPERIEKMHLDWSIQPSKIIILDIDAETALERKGGGEDKFEYIEFLSDVRRVYKEVFYNRDNIVVIDADQPKEKIFRKVEAEL